VLVILKELAPGDDLLIGNGRRSEISENKNFKVREKSMMNGRREREQISRLTESSS